MSISRRQRRRIFARDNFTCLWGNHPVQIGALDPYVRATLEHVVPRSRGGSNRAGNIITSCQYHNETRGDSLGPPPGCEDAIIPPTSDLEFRYRHLEPPPFPNGIYLDRHSAQYRSYRRWWNKRGYWYAAQEQMEESA